MVNNNIAHTDTGDVASPDNTWMNTINSTVSWDGASSFYFIAYLGSTVFEIASFAEPGVPSVPARAHYQRALMDAQGNLLAGSSVRLLDPATGLPITDPIYADAHADMLYPNPFVTVDGIINFYLQDPRRVNIGILQPGSVTEFVAVNMDLFAPPPSAPSP